MQIGKFVIQNCIPRTDIAQSVPPVWTALQDLWVWMDQELDEDRADFDGPIADRKAWWEQMVGRLMTTCGPLSLC